MTKIAPVHKSQVSDEEVARRIEVVRRERGPIRVSDRRSSDGAPIPVSNGEPTLPEFRDAVARLWTRQVVAAIRFAEGRCLGINISPRPLVLRQTE